ncbi:MAG TPA: hypothetical protein VN873_15015 [Candidatus Angelobacter sp.]|nr:hypothetical protein [Candidatus Angelobacter sp.]
MHFLRRHQYLFCFLGVLFFSCVMVIRQFEKNQARHVELREDFILLHDRGETKSEERLYQMLIQELPELNENALVDDLQRTAMLVDPKAPQLDNLIWKYEVSVKNELQKRSEQRLARAREEAAR